MRLPRMRFRLATLLSVVAVVAVVLAASRTHGNTGAAIALIAASVFGLARRRYADLLAARGTGLPDPGLAERAWLLARSGAIAVVLVGLSDLALLIGYHGFLRWCDVHMRMSHWSPYLDPVYMAIGFAIGAATAIWVAARLRMALWTIPGQPRRWRSLRPLIVVVLAGGWFAWSVLQERWEFCTMMAEYHAAEAAAAKTSDRAALHRWLGRWYARAAVRPWLPIHPDEGGSE